MVNPPSRITVLGREEADVLNKLKSGLDGLEAFDENLRAVGLAACFAQTSALNLIMFLFHKEKCHALGANADQIGRPEGLGSESRECASGAEKSSTCNGGVRRVDDARNLICVHMIKDSCYYSNDAIMKTAIIIIRTRELDLFLNFSINIDWVQKMFVQFNLSIVITRLENTR